MSRDPIVLAVIVLLLVLLILHVGKVVALTLSWPMLALILIVLLVLYLR